MSGRQPHHARSASIPIPGTAAAAAVAASSAAAFAGLRSSPSRTLLPGEPLFTLPFSASPASIGSFRPPSIAGSPPPVGAHSSASSNNVSGPGSPSSTNRRSGTFNSGAGSSPVRVGSRTNRAGSIGTAGAPYEPRVIRGAGASSGAGPVGSARSIDTASVLAAYNPSGSSARAQRRQSSAAALPAVSLRRPSLSASNSIGTGTASGTRRAYSGAASHYYAPSSDAHATPVPFSGHAIGPGSGPGFPPPSPHAPTSFPASFPRPAYLEHSALRHFLQTEAPPALPPSRFDTTPSAATSPAVPHAHHLHHPPRRGTPATDSDDDSIAPTPSPEPPLLSSANGAGGRSGALLALAGRPTLRLPTRWSDQDRHASLTVSGNGRDLSYHGYAGPSSSGEKDAAAARTNHPVPPACGIYYYEVEILSKGAKGHISIGFSAADVRLSRLPGWEKKSWGYHGDDGFSFAAEKNGTPYGPTFGTGDVIGCGIDFSLYKAFYTKNGALLGMVFNDIGRETELYPSVGLRHTGEVVRVNFGHEPFRYDIDDHVAQQRDAVWRAIQATRVVPVPFSAPPLDYAPDGVGDGVDESRGAGAPLGRAGVLAADVVALKAARMVDVRVAEGLIVKGRGAPSSITGTGKGDVDQNEEKERVQEAEDMKSPMEQLVLSYLTHHGYARSAKAFRMQVLAYKTARPGVSGSAGTIGTVSVSSGPPPTSTPLLTSDFDGIGPGMHDGEIEVRTSIVGAVARGDVSDALVALREHHPRVLARDGGAMQIKLRCRAFVEMIVAVAELGKRWRAAPAGAGEDGAKGPEATNGHSGLAALAEDEMVGAMDVDEDTLPSFTTRLRPPAMNGTREALFAEYNAALHAAIEYGKGVQAEYLGDPRPEVAALLNETFSVVAYEDPREQPGEVSRVAGQEARIALASELNQAILESQGRPTRPTLERVYRQAAACVVQLGLLGVGAAAFADMPKELLEA